MRLCVVGAGGVVQSKHLPAIWWLRTRWEPVTVEAIVEPNEQVGQKMARSYGCRWYGCDCCGGGLYGCGADSGCGGGFL